MNQLMNQLVDDFTKLPAVQEQLEEFAAAQARRLERDFKNLDARKAQLQKLNEKIAKLQEEAKELSDRIKHVDGADAVVNGASVYIRDEAVSVKWSVLGNRDRDVAEIQQQDGCGYLVIWQDYNHTERELTRPTLEEAQALAVHLVAYGEVPGEER